MSNFILTDRKTDYLLPPSVDDWLTQDQLARFATLPTLGHPSKR